jgi:hypothetical protein
MLNIMADIKQHEYSLLNEIAQDSMVTKAGVNSFNNNYHGTGLYANPHGNIILNNVTADNNGSIGMLGGADATLLVSCGSMNNNTSYGWEF